MLTLKNFKLSTKLNIILGCALLFTLTICGLSLSQILEKKVEQEVNNKAFLIIETINSVRKYTNNRIKPKLASTLENSDNFIPETVPAYSARKVFEELKSQPDYQNFTYKEATLNPTNPQDKADSFETKLIDKLRENQNQQEITGFRSDRGSMYYYIARPLAIKEVSCLDCHGTPEKAPKNLIATYGSENGFGWKLNSIVGIQIISVPANEVINAANNIKFSVIGIVFLFLIISILGINLFLKKSIIEPVKNMAKLSTQISTGDLKLKFENNSNDEIGYLANSLNRMILSLRMAIEMIDSQDK